MVVSGWATARVIVVSCRVTDLRATILRPVVVLSTGRLKILNRGIYGAVLSTDFRAASIGRWYRLPIVGSGLISCVGVLLVLIRVGCSVEWTRVDGTTVELGVGVVSDTRCVVLLLRVLVLVTDRSLMYRQYVEL